MSLLNRPPGSMYACMGANMFLHVCMLVYMNIIWYVCMCMPVRLLVPELSPGLSCLKTSLISSSITELNSLIEKRPLLHKRLTHTYT